MNKVDELLFFLPDTLPQWSKYVVFAMIIFHVIIMTLYCSCLFKEVTTSREPVYEKVRLAKDI